MAIGERMKDAETKEQIERRVRAEERAYLLAVLIELRLKGEADGAMLTMEKILSASPSKYVN